MHMQRDRTDNIIVVGGGLAGLAAATYLARAGHAVTVFEKSATIGGRAATRHVDGYAINQGIHALYTGGPASQVLRELGVAYTAGVPRTTFGLRGGRLYPLPVTPLGLLTTGLLDARDKLELARVMSALPCQDARRLNGTSTAAWLDATTRRPRVRQFVGNFAKTVAYSAALDLVSADTVVARFQQALKHPVHYVDGGWQVLVDGLRRAATAAGAEVIAGAAVEAVEHADGYVTGVRVHGAGWAPATAVVLAVAPAQALDLVDEGRYGPLREVVEPLVPVQVACLDVALRALPRPDRPVVADQERPLFLTVQSVYARVAPTGGGLIHAVKQLDPRHAPDPETDQRELEGLLDAAQPGWRRQVVHRAFLPHITAVEALPQARAGGLAGRPSSRVPGLANLLLAGDWIGADGYLADASLASARQAASLANTATEPATQRPLAVAA
jgi:phytoene dehydrogenase-like protein